MLRRNATPLEIRQALGLSKRQLAKTLRIDARTITRHETAPHEAPPIYVLALVGLRYRATAAAAVRRHYARKKAEREAAKSREQRIYEETMSDE